MINMWKDTRHKTTYIVATNFILIFLSYFFVINSFADKEFYFSWLYEWLSDSLIKMSFFLHIESDPFVIMCIIFLFVFCLLKFILKIFIIFSKSILINEKWNNIISNNKIYFFLRERRLGYFFCLPFLFDIIQCSLFAFLYFVCLKFVIKNNYFSSDLFINIFSLFILYVALPLLIIFVFCNSFHQLKHHLIKYIKSQKIGLIIHTTKTPLSTMSVPFNSKRIQKWFLLDQYEYMHLVSMNKINYQDLSFVIIYCSLMIADDELITIIKQIYEIPHIGIMLDLNDYCDKNDASKTYIKYSDCTAMHIDNKKVTYFDGLIGILKNSVGYPMRNLKALSYIRGSYLYDYYCHLYKSPHFIYSRFREIINVYGIRQAINGLFELMEYVLRISVFVEASLKGISFDDTSNSIRNFYCISEFLSSSRIFDSVSLIETKQYFHECRKMLYSKLNIEPPDFMTLPEIVKYVGLLRNATKGHGFIKDDELTAVYNLLFVITLIIFEKTDICSLFIRKLNDRIILSYKGEIIYNIDKYIFFNSDDELMIFWKKQIFEKNHKEKIVLSYNKFLTGEIIKMVNKSHVKF